MKLALELLRIILIFGLLGALGWIVLANIYSINEITEPYSWFGGIAILILLFVLYRSKFQFTGWYKAEDRKKMSRSVSFTLTSISLILILSPFILASLLD